MEKNLTKICGSDFFKGTMETKGYNILGMRSRVRRRGPSEFAGRQFQLLPGLHAARRVSIRLQFTNYTYQISRENLILSSVLC